MTSSSTSGPQLIRGVGLGSATALNMIDMIGVGPFITMPLIVSAMGGPQAMLGWILGAVFAMCDGLVWAELGAAMPRSGGSYGYLREIYGPNRLGRLISFLFIWQLSFSAPLSIASGAIGLAGYASYFWPGLEHQYAARLELRLPMLGTCNCAGWFRSHLRRHRTWCWRRASVSQDHQHWMDFETAVGGCGRNHGAGSSLRD